MIHAQREHERAVLAADVAAWERRGGKVEKLPPGAGKMLLDFDDDDSDAIASERVAA